LTHVKRQRGADALQSQLAAGNIAPTPVFISAEASMFPTVVATPPQRRPVPIARLLPALVLIVWIGVEAAWMARHGYRFRDWGISAGGVAALLILATVYGWRDRSAGIANSAYFAAMWVGFTCAGAIFTYLCAGMGYPLLDAAFVRSDAALGFHWLAMYEAVNGHAWVRTLLFFAYHSLGTQIVASLLLLSAYGMVSRLYELWWAAVLSLLVTSVLSGLLPAAGALAHFSVGLDQAVHLAHFYQLREGVDRSFTMAAMEGIITFPSYHVVMALLLMNAARATRLFWPMVAVNTLMIVATPFYGGHYLVDMLGGAIVAVLSVWAVRASMAAAARRNLAHRDGAP
jgi:hypothetical protein